MENKYDEIQKLIKRSADREWLENSFLVKDFAYCSNGTEAVFFDKKLSNLKLFEPPEKYSKLIYKSTEIEKNDILSFNIDLLKDIECEEIEEKCDACSGYGVVDYEFYFDSEYYTKEYDCPVCDSKGKTIKEDKRRILIIEHLYNIKRISTLKTISNFIKKDEICIVKQSNNYTIFRIDNIYLLLMRDIIEDDYKTIITITNK